ncbi:GNAT family N-acetyltransferase [Myroides pelagicus]|uniref:GNAT family N-acetyltransferase n=1 Tax=Myroides pelagicus TaxID=270914 RepID=UPI001F0454C9|nr:GNAT family N-acetyltransferase [Myroides pelagicus]
MAYASTQYWGKGYAIEAAKACLVFTKDELKLRRVYSFTTTYNIQRLVISIITF